MNPWRTTSSSWHCSQGAVVGEHWDVFVFQKEKARLVLRQEAEAMQSCSHQKRVLAGVWMWCGGDNISKRDSVGWIPMAEVIMKKKNQSIFPIFVSDLQEQTWSKAITTFPIYVAEKPPIETTDFKNVLSHCFVLLNIALKKKRITNEPFISSELHSFSMVMAS